MVGVERFELPTLWSQTGATAGLGFPKSQKIGDLWKNASEHRENIYKFLSRSSHRMVDCTIIDSQPVDPIITSQRWAARIKTSRENETLSPEGKPVREEEKYQRKHMWIRTWGTETGLDGLPHEDYSCIVEGEIVGRISAQYAGPTKGTFKWDGGHSRRIRATVLPQGGYAPNVHEAVRKVEDHYDMVRKAAGLPPVAGARGEP